MTRRLIALGALAFAAYIGYGVYAAGRDEKAPPPSNPQIVFHKGNANGQRLRSRSWSADYDRVVSNADQTVLELQNVRNGVIYKGGKPYLHVRAAHMTVNTISRDFTATGPLHVETVGTTPTRTFDTTSAVWNELAQKLTFAQPITIVAANDPPLHVGSMILDVKSGDIVMHDVAGPIRVKER